MPDAQHTDPRDADRAEIARLMTGWIHRGLGQWDRLAALFHPGATIDISWIEGPYEEFIERSRAMAAGPISSKHLVSSPVIEFSGDRAFVETNAVIYMTHADLRLGVEQHSRFLDRVAKLDGRWGIVHRDASYDMGWLTYPYGVELADPVRPELMGGCRPSTRRWPTSTPAWATRSNAPAPRAAATWSRPFELVGPSGSAAREPLKHRGRGCPASASWAS